MPLNKSFTKVANKVAIAGWSSRHIHNMRRVCARLGNYRSGIWIFQNLAADRQHPNDYCDLLYPNTQYRDGVAIQAKLDELIGASEAKRNFIGIEHLTEKEVEEFRKRFEKTVEEAAEEKQAA